MRLLPLLLAFPMLAAERPVPPPGVPVPPADRADIEAGLRELGGLIDSLKPRLGEKSLLLADVSVFREAVRIALQYDEFLAKEEIARAKQMLRTGIERAGALAAGKPAWASETGLVVRGYISKIDGSVQPYGLVVPPSWSPTSRGEWRVDAWFHGRNERLTELNFLHDRMTNPGQFTPPDTIVLHLYGRYCNANKFAGEVDLFEALDAVRQHYRIDPDRVTARGFSMGGAAAWHIGAHFAGMFAAVAPGAGFSETAEFLNVFQNEQVKPQPWEIKLYRMYDATSYARNFFNVPLVAYSGEIDRQIQAAKVMERELAKEGMTLRHVIGPQTPHRYHPDSKVEINQAVDAAAAGGRDPYPKEVRFITHTLRYDRMKWVRADALTQHWEPAIVDAVISGPAAVKVTTKGVDGFSLDFGPSGAPFDPMTKVTVTIDGTAVTAPGPRTDRSWLASFVRNQGRWSLAGEAPAGLRKRHGLQGPIDDAFLDRFIVVRPSTMPSNPDVARWTAVEMNRAIAEWRRHFRGEPIVKLDTQVSEADIASANLILWGDPAGNRVLGQVAAKLPVRWDGDAVVAAGKRYPAAGHVPVAIYPNPLNPQRYVVLNSGFTFREYDYLNNARQISKLPDWAVVDISTPPDSRWPGRIAAAGFFDETWQ